MDWKDIQRFRMPLLLGIGGIVAYSAFSRARAAAPASPPADAAAAAVAQGLSPEAALGVQQQAFMAGGGLGLQGAALGLQTAERGLDLAGIATMGAQALAGDVVGLASSLGTTLGQVASDVTNNLPDWSPPLAPAPVVVVQPAPSPSPSPSPSPTPAPAPTVTVKSRTAEYAISAGPGQVRYGTVNSAGAIAGARTVTFSSSSGAPVARLVSGGRLHWRTTAGGLTGWSLIPSWSTGTWSVRKRYKELLSNGTTRYTAWTSISKTGS